MHPTPPSVPPGWYRDPLGHGRRWWDGAHWLDRTRRDGRLPAWLSVPVVICGALVVPITVLAGVMYPVPTALSVLPGLLVLATITWLDRVEPEPASARVHAVLYGACVAGLIAGVVNSAVLGVYGEWAVYVIAAPVGEELLKGLGVVLAIKRREIRTTIDGVVYAGLVAGGFAFVENIDYFIQASMGGEAMLRDTFIARGVLSPFAHPLFSLWTGLGLGIGVRQAGRTRWWHWWGIGCAVALHATWNYIAVTATVAPALAYAAFAAILVSAVALLVAVRRRTIVLHRERVGGVVLSYGLTPVEHAMFRTYPAARAARRRLPRAHRHTFDAYHSALLRCAEHDDFGVPELQHRLVVARDVFLTTTHPTPYPVLPHSA